MLAAVENLLVALSRTTTLKNIKVFKEDIPEDLLIYFRKSGFVLVDTETTGLNLMRDQVCTVQLSDGIGVHLIIQINANDGWISENLKSLLMNPAVEKIFHHAMFDVSMIYSSLGYMTSNFRCTKLMSKIVRTYANNHSLQELSLELLDKHRDKKIRQSSWFVEELTQKQIQYALADVKYLLEIYNKLQEMIEARGMLRSGFTCQQLSKHAHEAMQNIIPLVTSGYGDPDTFDIGWLFKY